MTLYLFSVVTVFCSPKRFAILAIDLFEASSGFDHLRRLHHFQKPSQYVHLTFCQRSRSIITCSTTWKMTDQMLYCPLWYQILRMSFNDSTKTASLVVTNSLTVDLTFRSITSFSFRRQFMIWCLSGSTGASLLARAVASPDPTVPSRLLTSLQKPISVRHHLWYYLYCRTTGLGRGVKWFQGLSSWKACPMGAYREVNFDKTSAII